MTVICQEEWSKSTSKISPINALIASQISRLGTGGVRTCALDVKRSEQEAENDGEPKQVCDFSLSDKAKFEIGYYIFLAHPESLVSNSYGRKLMHMKL